VPARGAAKLSYSFSSYDELVRAPDAVDFTIEREREEDGRWLAGVPELPGVLAYCATAAEAMANAEDLALRVLAERLEHGESGPQSISIVVPAT
jgi:predicted RNase H-like HicB family nuclease